ncbi:MAG: hypothetical protein H6720_05450 [Sandaracinus sp.]|nr:hypothetical protein [Sandaracinus sp.]
MAFDDLGQLAHRVELNSIAQFAKIAERTWREENDTRQARVVRGRSEMHACSDRGRSGRRLFTH